MAEDGESSRITRANGLRLEAGSGLAGMRAVVGQNALGGPRDLRSGMEADLEVTNARLDEAERRVGGLSQEQVARTQKGAELLDQLAGEVGYQLPPSASVVVEVVPAAAERKSASSSILSIFRSLFKK